MTDREQTKPGFPGRVNERRSVQPWPSSSHDRQPENLNRSTQGLGARRRKRSVRCWTSSARWLNLGAVQAASDWTYPKLSECISINCAKPIMPLARYPLDLVDRRAAAARADTIPLLWDADFPFGPQTADGEDT